MTTGLLAELDGTLTPLLDVGLGYLTLDRPGASLSTGERQRIELTSTVRLSTTGMLYVLDEPSVGLHPSNVVGLRKTIAALAANGNSVVVVEHERELIRSCRLGHRARPRGRRQGRHGDRPGHPGPATKQTRTRSSARSWPAPRPCRVTGRRGPVPAEQIAIEIGDLYNLHDLTAAFPVHRLTALSGPSGAGKTALVLDSLIPAARALLSRVGAARRTSAA